MTEKARSASASETMGRPSQRIWTVAICAGVLLHAGSFALAWSALAPRDEEAEVGAPAIEIGLELTAPHQEQSDLPPGPEADAAVASSAAVEEKAKVEDTDLPKAQPTETEDPDRVVAPDASKTPKDDDPNRKEVKANAAAESAASEATAPPSVEAAREAPRSVAPAQGAGESAARVRATWQKELVAHLNRFKRYPPGASRRSFQVVVGFTLDRLGHVVSTTLQKGSGDPAFDRAALAMMAMANPVPAPPPAIADEGLTFAIPVIFRDKHK